VIIAKVSKINERKNEPIQWKGSIRPVQSSAKSLLVVEFYHFATRLLEAGDSGVLTCPLF